MTSYCGLRLGAGAVLAAAALLSQPALAVPMVTSADVTLNDPGGLGTYGPQTVAAGTAIVAGDGSSIGTNVLLNGESIAVNSSSIVYTVLGGQYDGPGTICADPSSTYTCTGYGTAAALVFNLSFSDAGDFIQGVTAKLGAGTAYPNVLGFSFTADTVTMDVAAGDLGLPNHNTGAQDFGSVELDLTIANANGGGGGNSVPEPASSALVGIGLALAALVKRRRRAYS